MPVDFKEKEHQACPPSEIYQEPISLACMQDLIREKEGKGMIPITLSTVAMLPDGEFWISSIDAPTESGTYVGDSEKAALRKLTFGEERGASIVYAQLFYVSEAAAGRMNDRLPLMLEIKSHYDYIEYNIRAHNEIHGTFPLTLSGSPDADFRAAARAFPQVGLARPAFIPKIPKRA